MNTKNLLFLFFLLFSFLSYAQEAALQTISENDLEAHLEFIAGDNMQGREFFTDVPGLELTAEYLKAQCAKMGLKPGFETYFQPIEMIAEYPDSEQSVFKVLDSNGDETYAIKGISWMGGQRESDTITGEIVFAGYGWHDEETQYNDIKGLDLKGKIVLAMTRNPEMVKAGQAPLLRIETGKMAKALRDSAKALVLVNDPMNPDSDFITSLQKYTTGGSLKVKREKEGKAPPPSNPARLIFGTEELANKILAGSGKTLAELQKEINESETPKSFEVDQLTAEVQLIKMKEEIIGKNVVAVVEGSDPELKDECIVFSAHYDHLGVNGEGAIYNGADDNGSGTVALLEIAEAFQSLETKPKRSIVFVWVTAEEKGLFGSEYYAENPAFPLENTLLDINLDMVGRSAEQELVKVTSPMNSLAGPNGIYIISGNQSSELTDISNAICEELGLIPSDALTRPFLKRSDYYHFYKNRIPILGLSTGLHNDYHQITDELDKIDYHKMKRVAQYAFRVAYKVANQDERLVVDNPVE